MKQTLDINFVRLGCRALAPGEFYGLRVWTGFSSACENGAVAGEVGLFNDGAMFTWAPRNNDRSCKMNSYQSDAEFHFSRSTNVVPEGSNSFWSSPSWSPTANMSWLNEFYPSGLTFSSVSSYWNHWGDFYDSWLSWSWYSDVSTAFEWTAYELVFIATDANGLPVTRVDAWDPRIIATSSASSLACSLLLVLLF